MTTSSAHMSMASPAVEDSVWQEMDFETFAAARWRRLVRTAYLLTGDHHEAEDLVQATLAKIYTGWTRIRRLSEPDAYVHRALINNNLSRYRRRRVRQLLTPVLPERPHREDVSAVENRSVLMAALAELPPRQRMVVVLRYWEDMSEHQVAEAMDCSVGNVKSQANRGLSKLRAHPALAGYAAGTATGAAARTTETTEATPTGNDVHRNGGGN